MHVARLLLLSAFCCSLFAATPKPQRSSQEIVAPFWTLEPGWHTSLEIRNNNATDVIAVTPVLRTNEGREVTLPVVSLHPDEARTLDLQQIVDSSQVRIPENPYGSLTLRYSAFSLRNIYAATMVHMPGHPIGFHFDAVGAYGKGSVRDFEGLWWLPTEASTAYLFITNSTDKPVRASLGFSSSAGIMNDQMLPLGPRQTRRISVRELVQRHKLAGTYGGIGVHLISDEGAVQVTQFVFDETIGFSAVLRMFEHFENAGAPRFPLRAPMVALSRPDPALNFPADTELQSRIFLRNTTAKAVLPTVIVHWRTSGEQGSVPINASELSANEVRLLDLSALQRSGRIPADASWANVEISHSGRVGDVIAIAASYDPSLRYGTQTPFTRIVSSFWKGSLWRVDGTHASFITAGNSGDTPVAANVALISPDGKFRYELPEHTLAPDEQIWVDLRDLIRNRIPDRNGKVLPADMTTGTYEIWESRFSAMGQLFEGKLIIDKTYGHATYGCGSCCGVDDGGYQTLDPFVSTVGGNNQQVAWGQNRCTGNWQRLNPYSWFSYDINVATITDSGVVMGVAPGGTFVESRSETLSPYPSCEPYEVLQQAQVEVQPTVSGPNTVWYFAGENPSGYATEITLTSSGGASTIWSAIAGDTKISMTPQGSTVKIRSSGTSFSSSVGDIQIVAQTNNVSSEPFHITTRTPNKMTFANQTHDCDNDFGYSDFISYSVVDQLETSLPTAFPAGEKWTTPIVSDMTNNWPRPVETGATGTAINDHITGVGTYSITNPPPVTPPDPAPTCFSFPSQRVQHWGQEWRVGSTTAGLGRRVQSNTFVRFNDHAAHESPVSPNP